MRPNKEDYLSYYDYYINLIPENDVISALQNNHQFILNFIHSIPKEKAEFAYASGKWTVKQVLNHMIDTERIFIYRALRFARHDDQITPSFDENSYAEHANLKNTDINLLAEEFNYVRQSSILFFKQLSEKELFLKGNTAAGQVNVLSLGYMMCGHAQHHINVIKEKYLKP